MPYIAESDRQPFRRSLDLLGALIETPGELNYCITQLCGKYLLIRDLEPRYGDYNEVIGVLECAKQEFYRRVVVPYEEKRIEESGDVF